MPGNVVVIGGGIGGLATAILLSKTGYQVSLYEQLGQLGGRARQFKAAGFTFDMGPSWYLMPGVFEHFFELIGEDITKHLSLERLDPGYKVFYENSRPITITGNLKKDASTFDAIEAGSGKTLENYVARAGKTYHTAVQSFLYTNFSTTSSFINKDTLKSGAFMAKIATTSIDSYVSKYFKDQRLKQILEYPMVFLGASPFNAPALYHLMSYLDFVEGVYYPKGGIYTVIEALIKIAKQNGVKLHTNSPIQSIDIVDGAAGGVRLYGGELVPADVVISNADVHFTETQLLRSQYQTYPQEYWDKKQNGPSALLMYLGVKGSLPQLEHHNLYFAEDWQQNFSEIFTTKEWPENPSLYICNPSRTDKTVAPAGHENLFVLVPLPARLTKASEAAELSDKYLANIAKILQVPNLNQRIVYKKLFTPTDFANQYNSWQGSALGLSHTLNQSAFFRPKNKSTKVANLYYVGGNTIPGIGLPMCLIGAELIYKRLVNDKTSGPLKELK
jgi:phytoene desaturase